MSTDTPPSTHSQRVRTALPHLYVPFAYLLLAIVFHAIDVNIFRVSLAPGDGAVHGVPSKIYDAELSLWNPYILSGVSRLATQGFQTLYWPGILIMKMFPSGFGYNLNLLLHYALAGFFTFLFASRLGLRAWSAFISGICFMFSGFMVAHKGHHMMMNAATWLPLVLYLAERYLAERRQRFWLVLSAVAYAMSFYADYLAVPMYIAMVTVPYICFRCAQTSPRLWPTGVLRAFLDVSTFLVFGLLFAAPYIFPILESVPQVTREHIDYAFFSSYSFLPQSLPLLLFPFIFGTHTPGFYKASYFGPWNLTEVAGYMGVVPVALAIFAFLAGRKQNRQIWFWWAAAAMGFVLVLGEHTPLHRLLYHVPVYKMFRAPARNWLEVNFAVAVLAGFGIDLIGRGFVPRLRIRHLQTRIWGALALMTLLFAAYFSVIRFLVPFVDIVKGRGLLNWATGSGFGVREYISLIRECWSPLSPNFYVPLLVVLLGGIVTYAALFWLRDEPRRWGLLALAIVGDLFTFGHFHDSHYSAAYSAENLRKSALYQYLQGDPSVPSDYRMLPLETLAPDELFPNVNLPLHVPTVNGYGAILLKNYAKLLGLETWGTVHRAPEIIEGNGILSMLATRYLVTSDPALKAAIERSACKDLLAQGVPCSPLVESHSGPFPTYTRVLQTEQGISVYRNNKAQPRHRIAKGIRCVGSFAEAERIMRDGKLFDPATTTLVECGPGFPRPEEVKGGNVVRTEVATADRWVGTVSTEGTAVLVRSESYYPGWTASVDGRAVPLLKVNGVIQGVLVPTAGMHQVEFAFKPRSFRLGLAAALVGLLAAGVMLALRSFRTSGRSQT